MPQALHKEKAGCGGRQQPAANTIQGQSYGPTRPPSSPCPENPPGRRDRCLTQSGTRPGCGLAALSLFIVLLAFQGRDFPPRNRHPAVALAEQWAREIVDAQPLRCA